jgi:hypothetical protein
VSSFKVEIELGNDGMSTRQHIAEALNDLARRVLQYGLSRDDLPIHDYNGNRVGVARFQDDEERRTTDALARDRWNELS